MLAISLYRKSRTKNDFERRILPKSSAPFTDFGFLTTWSSEHPGPTPCQLLSKGLILRLQFADSPVQRTIIHRLSGGGKISDRVENFGHGCHPSVAANHP